MQPSDLVGTAQQWCRGVLARDPWGRPVSPFAADACSFCPWGAALRCLPTVERALFLTALRSIIGGKEPIVTWWSDGERLTHPQMLAAVRRAEFAVAQMEERTI